MLPKMLPKDNHPQTHNSTANINVYITTLSVPLQSNNLSTPFRHTLHQTPQKLFRNSLLSLQNSCAQFQTFLSTHRILTVNVALHPTPYISRRVSIDKFLTENATHSIGLRSGLLEGHQIIRPQRPCSFIHSLVSAQACTDALSCWYLTSRSQSSR